MRNRVGSTLGVVILLTIAVLGAALGSGVTMRDDAWFPRFNLPTFAPPPAPPLPPDAAFDNSALAAETSLPFGQIFVSIAVLLVLAYLALVARRLLRARHERRDLFEEAKEGDLFAGGPEDGEQVLAPAELLDAVDLALRRLAEHRQPRDAVQAAWVELELAAARTGIERIHSETATEFTSRLLAGTPAPPAETGALRDLYLSARFSQEPVADAAVVTARRSLEAIARSLTGPRARPSQEEGA
ncbi:MAG: DUF4129 domain-containing protein [Promicromonosporaceae bacterium]|nr:DUF4129 domain-containing protein [Promicromonosporaceae bacterium]